MAPHLPRRGAAIDADIRSSRRNSCSVRRPAALLTLLLFVGINAVGGGISLIATNGLGMPLELLDGTPFTSYVIPGAILAMAVGGSHLLSAWLIWAHHPKARHTSLAAGLILLGWIATQATLVGVQSWLQPAMAGLALLTIWLTRHVRLEPHRQDAQGERSSVAHVSRPGYGLKEG